MHTSKILARLVESEALLADAFVMMADRHAQEPEVRDIAPLLASWSERHTAELRPYLQRYGDARSEQPERLRDALFHDPRVGALGLVLDLHDLSLLVHQVHLSWVELQQAAEAALDRGLSTLCARLGRETDRQAAWLRTQLKVHAPQALAVPGKPGKELRASLPRPAMSAVPDVTFAPVGAAVALLVVGLIGLLFGRLWVLPSLGATALLVAADPAHPSSRAANIVAGHLVALVAGVALLFAFDLDGARSPLAAGELLPAHVLAAALAAFVTLLVLLLVQLPHPPAGATALLAALGALSSPAAWLDLLLGVLVLAGLAALTRRLREGRGRRRRETSRPRRLEPALRAS